MIFKHIRQEKFVKLHCGLILKEDISWEEEQPYAKLILVSHLEHFRIK